MDVVESPLKKALKARDLNLVRQLAQQPQDASFYSPLMLAAELDFAEAVQSLAGFAGGRDQYGQTALVKALLCESESAAHALFPLEAGSCGVTAEMCAAGKCNQINEDTEKSESQSIDSDAQQCHTTNQPSVTSSGETALHFAAAVGNVQWIQGYKGLLDCVNSRGQTAFHLASQKARSNALEALLKLQGGLKVAQLRDAHGLNPLQVAAKFGNVQCVEQLGFLYGTSSAWGESALMLAAREGHVSVCVALGESEQRIRSKHGLTALMMAAEAGHAEVCGILASFEAGLQDPRRETALMKAARLGHADVVRVLAGVEKDMRDARGRTALILAIQEVK